MTKFDVIPAVDLMDGKCVQLQQGDPNKLIFSDNDPLKIAKFWEKSGARIIHIVDLDGALKGSMKNLDVILNIREKVNCKLHVGGGIRNEKLANKLLNAGIDKIILGTSAVTNEWFVKKLISRYPKKIIIAADAKKEIIVIEGWKRRTRLSVYDLIKKYNKEEVSFLFTNVDVEGLMRGSNITLISQILSLSSKPVYVSGGICKKDEIIKIKQLGARGVIIGSALYTGKLNFRDLTELMS